MDKAITMRKRSTGPDGIAPDFLAAETQSTRYSTRALWAGRILSGLAAAFLIFDAAVKFLMPPAAVEATSQLGWPESAMLTLGVIQLICLAAYLIPRTAVIGALLWTGYLGGAIATHVRVENPLFSHTLFPIYVAAFLWAGLWLRDRRVRALYAK
jgi:hypothetical protein